MHGLMTHIRVILSRMSSHMSPTATRYWWLLLLYGVILHPPSVEQLVLSSVSFVPQTR